MPKFYVIADYKLAMFNNEA